MSASCLDGLLLSDGNLSQSKPHHNARYQQTANDPAFLDWCRSALPTPARVTGPHPWRGYTYWMLRSPCDPVYTTLRSRWYPEGHKRIPSDFLVSGESMVAAYMGDGSSGRTSKAISIALYAFGETAVDAYIGEPLRQFGVDCTTRKNGVLAIRTAAIKNWFELIGPCPVSSMSRKWEVGSW